MVLIIFICSKQIYIFFIKILSRILVENMQNFFWELLVKNGVHGNFGNLSPKVHFGNFDFFRNYALLGPFFVIIGHIMKP